MAQSDRSNSIWPNNIISCAVQSRAVMAWWTERRTCNPRLWVRILALEGIVHDPCETLEQGTEPPTAPRAPQCRLPTAPSVCALGWVKCRGHISLLVILCIIVYLTNKKIITWHSWLVLSCIGSQWAFCSTFNNMTSACCSSFAACFRNPPPSPAPPV